MNNVFPTLNGIEQPSHLWAIRYGIARRKLTIYGDDLQAVLLGIFTQSGFVPRKRFTLAALFGFLIGAGFP